jgi:hypothetical protein
VGPPAQRGAGPRTTKKGAADEAVTVTASAADVVRAWEALRAEAGGELPGASPRGRAVLLRAAESH